MTDTNLPATTVTRTSKTEAEISGELGIELLAPYRAELLREFAATFEADGFRRGRVPENIIVAKIGDMALLEKTAERAFRALTPRFLKAAALETVGRPEIIITKLAPGNPVVFKMRVFLAPEVTLPDYKAIAKEVFLPKEDIQVDDEELERVITDIRKSRARKAAEGEAGGEKELPLPALDDEFVRTLGDFADVADFKKKLRENILQEKAYRAGEKRRIAVMEKIIAAAEITLPEILIDAELERLVGGLKQDLERMGIRPDEYFKKAGKTEEAIRKEWRPEAERRAKIQIALNEISKKENLVPAPEDIEAEVSHILEHHKDADLESLRAYVQTVLANEQIFKFLENQK